MKLRLLVILILAPVLVSGADDVVHEFGWLAGCWVSPDKSSQEVWVIDDERSLSGFSVTLRNGEIGFYELMRIKQHADGVWVFTAHPAGQPSASFTAESVSDSSVVFVNSEHDYPQQIAYRREADDLYATVSLLGGQNPMSFDKVACAAGP